MFHSVLDNRQYDTWAEYIHDMGVAYEQAGLGEQCVRRPENYRRLRLITRQYVEHRRRLQALTDLKSIERWLNANHIGLFNVPMNFLDDRRTPVSPNSFKFENMEVDENIDVTARYEVMTEEAVKGIGWTGELIATVPTYPRYDTWALRFALNSFGIYASESEYGSIDGQSYYGLTVWMLERDFKIKDFDPAHWVNAAQMSDERIDEMSVEEIEEMERRELFDDDIQFRNMGLDSGFD